MTSVYFFERLFNFFSIFAISLNENDDLKNAFSACTIHRRKLNYIQPILNSLLYEFIFIQQTSISILKYSSADECISLFQTHVKPLIS